jgi:acetamidase/formamidase
MAQEQFVKSIHHIHHGKESKLLSFNKDHKPLATIDSGDEVSFDNRHAGFHKITRHTTDAELIEMGPKTLLDIEQCMGPIYVDGPVYVKGAEPGDILKVEILELQTGDWGWTAIFPGLGLLQDEIPGPHIRTFDLRQDYAVFKAGVHIPCQPFYGTMGVAPAEEGDLHPLFPRNDIGGNFDCRYLGQGAVMYLPVNVTGALFSVGDGHFSQGDGEITGTALETTMKSRIRLSVIKGKISLKSPHYRTNPERVKDMHNVGEKGEYGVLATAEDRDKAVKEAVRGLLDWLVAEKALTRVEGYMLFSIAGNLKMMHDLGLEVFTVSASIPLGLFVE